MTGQGEIISIMADAVRDAAKGCRISYVSGNGKAVNVQCPPINYVFGNSQYIKERLDELSLSPGTSVVKFPLVALFCPFTEQRGIDGYFTQASVSMLIAVSSKQQWSNEQRQTYSFESQLRPIYRSLLNALSKDARLDFGYKGLMPHGYSENYSYGRYGAMTSSGDSVSEPIDAINIKDLEIKVKIKNCR